MSNSISDTAGIDQRNSDTDVDVIIRFSGETAISPVFIMHLSGISPTPGFSCSGPAAEHQIQPFSSASNYLLSSEGSTLFFSALEYISDSFIPPLIPKSSVLMGKGMVIPLSS